MLAAVTGPHALISHLLSPGGMPPSYFSGNPEKGRLHGCETSATRAQSLEGPCTQVNALSLTS